MGGCSLTCGKLDRQDVFDGDADRRPTPDLDMRLPSAINALIGGRAP